MKIVVFDLDETLGYFTQYGIFWDSLCNYLKTKNIILTQKEFNDTLDLFPDVLRPNIINILNYLKEKKQSNCCHKIMIYTNNNGPREWAEKILSYFEKKIDYDLIDQIIAAFKVNGKKIELCRTTNSKTHKDLIRCTKIPDTAEICFLDDTFYPGMTNNNIYYINVKPYYYDYEFNDMLNTFKKSELGIKLIKNDINFDIEIIKYIKQYNYNCIHKNLQEHEVDKSIGKQIIVHLREFFNRPKKTKTIKNKTNKINNVSNKTRKR